MKRGYALNDERFAVVTTTCANEDEADKIASALINNKLAACVQMLPIKSRFVWNGEFCADKEILLLIKCRSDKYSEIEQAILEHHSYDLPEILLTPVAGGYSKYLEWINSE
jgi:periplasmic divalent cation tolerance protein